MNRDHSMIEATGTLSTSDRLKRRREALLLVSHSFQYECVSRHFAPSKPV
jgi:hypothetical protein